MKAKDLKTWLSNIPDDTEIKVDFDDPALVAKVMVPETSIVGGFSLSYFILNTKDLLDTLAEDYEEFVGRSFAELEEDDSYDECLYCDIPYCRENHEELT